jgi:L-amino acid ligase
LYLSTGVELADQLAHGMGLRNNGLAKSLARRNKYHMGENVRAAGEFVTSFVRSISERALTSRLLY